MQYKSLPKNLSLLYSLLSFWQFLGSEESILEFEPDRPIAHATTTTTPGTGAVIVPAGIDAVAQRQPVGALSDLVRSRDFVIDFPRVFVLEAGGALGTRETLFPPRLPERSQSSMCLEHAKDWMSTMTNKLDEQHGLKRFRKQSEMQENLIDLRTESFKKRRSRSADGRYSHGYFGRREIQRHQTAQNVAIGTGNGAVVIDMPPAEPKSGRRLSVGLSELTDASYALSMQRRREYLEQVNTRRRRSSARAGSDMQAANDIRENSPPMNVDIKIQVNGEGIDLD